MHEAKRMNRLEHSADDRKIINKRNFRQILSTQQNRTDSLQQQQSLPEQIH